MKFRVAIPARYASTRLPGKPLLDIVGKPMIWHVYQRAIESGATQVIIATDDTRISDVAQNFGATVCMTASTHRSGTERIVEVIEKYQISDNSIIVNVQGDEPLLPPDLIRQTAESLINQSTADMATLCQPISNLEILFNPNVVKVILDKQGFALYFSRAPIPWHRDKFAPFDTIKKVEQSALSILKSYNFARHIGIYAYRAGYLKQYKQFPPCSLEYVESLEQLRVLFNGGKIFVSKTTMPLPISVDTFEDLEKVRLLKN